MIQPSDDPEGWKNMGKPTGINLSPLDIRLHLPYRHILYETMLRRLHAARLSDSFRLINRPIVPAAASCAISVNKAPEDLLPQKHTEAGFFWNLAPDRLAPAFVLFDMAGWKCQADRRRQPILDQISFLKRPPPRPNRHHHPDSPSLRHRYFLS